MAYSEEQNTDNWKLIELRCYFNTDLEDLSFNEETNIVINEDGIHEEIIIYKR